MKVPRPGAAHGRLTSRALLAVAFVAACSMLLPSGLVAADPSAAPEASPASTLAPPEAMCDSVADLRLIVEFLRGTDVDEDGWLPVLVGVIAGLSEARQLAGNVGETYGPLVDDLTASLEAARTAIDDVREAETLGASIATIGEAIAGVGYAMDALSVQLRSPCPTAAPAATATPAA